MNTTISAEEIAQKEQELRSLISEQEQTMIEQGKLIETLQKENAAVQESLKTLQSHQAQKTAQAADAIKAATEAYIAQQNQPAVVAQPPPPPKSNETAIVKPPSETSTVKKKPTDWTYEHIRTLIYWLNIANINIFLLDASIQYYKKLITRVMAITFLFSSLSTTVSLSQLGINETENPGLANAIKYIFITASTISTLLVGYIKLFKMQEMMDANTEMHKEWLEFATKISGELQMPIQLRTPALNLLQDMKAMYIGLFCKRPFISSVVRRYANKYFETCKINDNRLELEKRPTNCWNCWSSFNCFIKPNYIKRTNVFFVFQDIMKNEIKRLAIEIEIGNLRVNRKDSNYFDDDIADPSEMGAPRIPDSSELLPNVRIDYEYEGPFIVICFRNESIPDKPKRYLQSPQKQLYKPLPEGKTNFGDQERVLYLQKEVSSVRNELRNEKRLVSPALPSSKPIERERLRRLETGLANTAAAEHVESTSLEISNGDNRNDTLLLAPYCEESSDEEPSDEEG